MFDTTDQLAVNTIRTLSMDGIQKANSGHPGLPMGAAPMAYTLWTKHLKVNPKNSSWTDRDRFVLSDMDQCFYIACYIYLVMRLLWMI